MKFTGRLNPHLNALQRVTRLPVRTCPPHRQAPMAFYAAQRPFIPDDEFHEATPTGLPTGDISPIRSQFRGSGQARSCYLYHSGCEMRSDEERGKKCKGILSHSVMIQREWSRKEPISLPFCRRNESWRREWSSKGPISFPIKREQRGEWEGRRKRTMARVL